MYSQCALAIRLAMRINFHKGTNLDGSDARRRQRTVNRGMCI